ncbi:MAG: hypothetical protein F6K26_44820 [Moorea sp. SIO2I5]|nr:hypothetical protein [Moorena sp. SIO2I5]
MEAETTQRTPRQILIQASVGAAAALPAGMVIISIYRCFWHTEIPMETLLFLSLGFSIYCGVLSARLGQRFWYLLGISLVYIILEMCMLAIAILLGG